MTLGRALLLLILVLVLGALIFLLTWDIPPPVHQVEEPVPAEQLPR
jgi:hypothetical protein